MFAMRSAYKVSCTPLLEKKAAYFIDKINDATKLNGKVVYSSEAAQVRLSLSENSTLGDEGYELEINPEFIEIRASKPAGILYGITSLVQLTYEYKDFGVIHYPCLEITDIPKHKWRSFMFDSGRQYHSLKYLKTYLNHMAMLKMNIFHWHLTEHDGWRIEIKKYPKLTSIGSKVGPWPEQDGFYTQDEIREIVAYAKELNIEVVPEIDLPGHSNAALYAYPEMTCKKEKPVRLDKGHSPVIFCGGREETYTFIENVLDEVCTLFESDYIHLGGDEAPKEHWEECPDCQARIKKEGLKNEHDLQLYFSKRLALYLKEKGKKVIFWDDVVEEDGVKLPDNTVIQWWKYRATKDLGLRQAKKYGFPVIGSTNYYTYLFFPVTPWSRCLENRTFDLRKVYNENPSDIEDPDELYLGIGTCQWCDYNMQEYMNDRFVFPRIYALSEQMWSTAKRLPFDDFYEKVKGKYPYLEAIGVDYGQALKEEVPEGYKWQEHILIQ